MKSRIAAIERNTREVKIRGRLNLDGSGRTEVSTGVRFLDHMLELFAKHGLFDLKLKARGDIDIDLHHTNEDLGLALGQAFRRALADKKGIRRMGHAFVPMDETLARVRSVADLSGRPSFHWDWHSRQPQTRYRHGSYDVDDARHFLASFVTQSGITLHIDVLKAGGDVHHLLESIFKALGRSLREAVEIDPRVKGVPSTKGKL